jgi:hypothetical protein
MRGWVEPAAPVPAVGHANMLAGRSAVWDHGTRRPRQEGWWKFLLGLFKPSPVKPIGCDRAGRSAAQEVLRVTQLKPDLWVVGGQGNAIEQSFSDLHQAIAFIGRGHSDSPVTIELLIDDLYIVAHLDPGRPQTLFGEKD